MKSAMRAELEAFEMLLKQLSKISSRTDAERRTELVKLRRDLANRIGSIGTTAQELFKAEGATALESEFRKRLSNVRSSVALHQAKWPAVTINDVDSDFMRSAAAVREGNKEFLNWCRESLL